MRTFLAVCFGLTALPLLTGCKKEEEPRTTAIKVISITPAGGSRINSATEIRAQVEYSLADSEQSTYGYTVNMRFKNGTGSIGPGSGTSGNVVFSDRSGRIDLSTTLTNYWNRIDHPVTCYLSINRQTSSSGNSSTIAQQAVVFTE